MLNTQLQGPEGLALGHRTVDEMGRQLLPVSPQNYEVWLTKRGFASRALKASGVDSQAARPCQVPQWVAARTPACREIAHFAGSKTLLK